MHLVRYISSRRPWNGIGTVRLSASCPRSKLHDGIARIGQTSNASDDGFEGCRRARCVRTRTATLHDARRHFRSVSRAAWPFVFRCYLTHLGRMQLLRGAERAASAAPVPSRVGPLHFAPHPSGSMPTVALQEPASRKSVRQMRTARPGRLGEWRLSVVGFALGLTEVHTNYIGIIGVPYEAMVQHMHVHQADGNVPLLCR
ncbi:hypothetical protein PsYK624_013330 [Phanerochaete sordida]|uniref:Uncharacterized protein n=1 Tax=Phanerochaete sordida TaxID=48140 RepID=A0A9P3L7R3_9APHY|nr:hypothetical protein PsYK624_013330 [Phanerochaete sordida]